MRPRTLAEVALLAAQGDSFHAYPVGSQREFFSPAASAGTQRRRAQALGEYRAEVVAI